MDSAQALQAIRRELERIRTEYVAAGRGDEFDAYLSELSASIHWPPEG